MNKEDRAGSEASPGAARLKIVEGLASVWHYHLSETGRSGYPALCGNARVMHTLIPLSNWMDEQPSHLPSSYCKSCDAILKARSAPEAKPKGPNPNLESPIP